MRPLFTVYGYSYGDEIHYLIGHYCIITKKNLAGKYGGLADQPKDRQI